MTTVIHLTNTPHQFREVELCNFMDYICCCFRVKKTSALVPQHLTYGSTIQLVPPPSPVINGKNCEVRVRNMFRQRGIDTLDQTAGSTNAQDVVLVVRGQRYGVEVKSKNASEGGQKMFQYVEDRLVLDDEFFSSLIGDYVPFKGKVPSFLKGDKTIETWIVEKGMFKGEYVSVEDDAVTRYYAKKGSSYIFIESKGLYHTGEDPCEFGVPEFRGVTRMRIRCKQHGKSSVPGSVMASLVFKHPTEQSWFV